MEDGTISTKRVDTKNNLADIMTKALLRVTHEDQVAHLNMRSGGEGLMADMAQAGDEFHEAMRSARRRHRSSKGEHKTDSGGEPEEEEYEADESNSDSKANLFRKITRETKER